MSKYIAPRIIRFAILLICGVLFFFSGCSDKIDYSAGIVTMMVEGSINLDQHSYSNQAFVITRKYHRSFVSSSTGNLYRVSASIVRPDENGHFEVRLNSEVDRVDLMVVAEGYQFAQQSFQRTLGIGSYSFQAKLEKDPNWRDNYYLLIKPTLSEYITEQRYRMKNTDQMFLGDWFNEVEKDW